MNLSDIIYDIRRWLTWRKVLAFIGGLLLLVPVLAFLALWYISSHPNIPPHRPIEKYAYLAPVENDPACEQQNGLSPAATGPQISAGNSPRKPGTSYQGWCEQYRQNYYRRPQGTTFFDIRYDWVANLERPVGRKPLMTRAYMESIGYIYDGAPVPTTDNPYDMPIGLTWHRDPQSGDRILDVTCAACHSSQFTYQGTAIQIDGGSGGHALTSTDPSQFILYSVLSMMTTVINPAKFDRFAEKVLPEVGPDDELEQRGKLSSAMWASIRKALVYGWNNPPSLYPTTEGYGRTDGLGRIVNTVFGDRLSHHNYRVGDAPVNYPHLWDIWQFDWVQWMGSVKQAMARNVNESLGVRATLELKDPERMFESSALLSEMHCIETSLQHLKPPRWPEDIFGKVDMELATQGAGIFSEVCAKCHGPFKVAGSPPAIENSHHPVLKPLDTPCATCHGPWGHSDEEDQNGAGMTWLQPATAATSESDYRLQLKRNGYWKVLRTPIEYVGTDATSATNFINNTYDLSALKDTAAGKAVTAPPEGPTDQRYIDDWEHVPGAVGLRFIGGEVRFRNYTDWGLWNHQERKPTDQDAVDDLNAWGELDRPIAFMAYRPRPLEGIWATAPFLHNGSVPSIYELLLPADERTSEFYLGRKEYDPVNLGIRTEKFPGAFKYDTTIKGNSNLGHEFDDGLCGNGVIGYQVKERPGFCRQFTEGERMALLEYLKIHSDGERLNPGTLAHCRNAHWEGME